MSLYQRNLLHGLHLSMHYLPADRQGLAGIHFNLYPLCAMPT